MYEKHVDVTVNKYTDSGQLHITNMILTLYPLGYMFCKSSSNMIVPMCDYSIKRLNLRKSNTLMHVCNNDRIARLGDGGIYGKFLDLTESNLIKLNTSPYILKDITKEKYSEYTIDFIKLTNLSSETIQVVVNTLKGVYTLELKPNTTLYNDIQGNFSVR